VLCPYNGEDSGLKAGGAIYRAPTGGGRSLAIRANRAGRGSARLDTIGAGFYAGAYDVVLREPTPSPEFSTERASAR